MFAEQWYQELVLAFCGASGTHQIPYTTVMPCRMLPQEHRKAKIAELVEAYVVHIDSPFGLEATPHNRACRELFVSKVLGAVADLRPEKDTGLKSMLELAGVRKLVVRTNKPIGNGHVKRKIVESGLLGIRSKQ